MLEVKTQTELHLWHKRSNFKLIAVVQGTFHALNWRAHKRTFSYLSFWGFSCNFNQLWKLHDPTISFENLCREQTRFTGRSNMQFNTNAFLEILLQPPPAYLLCPVWNKKSSISSTKETTRQKNIVWLMQGLSAFHPGKGWQVGHLRLSRTRKCQCFRWERLGTSTALKGCMLLCQDCQMFLALSFLSDLCRFMLRAGVWKGKGMKGTWFTKQTNSLVM